MTALRSAAWFAAEGKTGIMHRSWLRSEGLPDDSFEGRPVIGMAEAALAEIKRLGAQRITLLTPYDAAVNALVQAYVEACGLTVAAIAGLPVASAIAAAGLHPEQTIAAAAEAVAIAPTDLLWIPCSNVRALDLCGRMTREFGCPCLSSNRALLTVMLARLERGRQAAAP